MDEPGLIEDARNGDINAFNGLVLAYQDRLYNQAYRMLGDEASAADATQEAFISAYNNLPSFRGGVFRAWLFRIVTNLCYDELRRRKRRPTTPLEPIDNDDQENESPRWMIDPTEGPEETAERAELWRAIQNCLDHLSPDSRAVVVLIDIQGLDYKESADVLNCALGTIKSRLARARQNLRDCLDHVAELIPFPHRLNSEGIL